MWERIVAFFMSIIAFFAGLFGIDMEGNSDYVYKNLAYGSHERQIMDLYLPEENDGEVGLVLMIHGGAWIAGDKDAYKDAIKTACNDLGYAAAAINYRYLSEDVDMHDIIDDIGASLSKIKETAAGKGITINKVLLSGSSAGAHLSMLYAYSEKETAPITPAAVVSYCGPTDLTDENYYYNSLLGMNSELGDYEWIAKLFSFACGQDFDYAGRAGAIEALKAVSPLYYVDENTVPTVINHGEKDTIVPYSNATAIVEKFKQCGVAYDFNSYPNSGHELGNDTENAQVADDLLYEYLMTYLGREATAKW
ncbi:MAG: alpha/beta hydrolase [Clostridia bacterium]|nr:alpha/beta hydrolase [Clostridia bacterium]